MEVIVGIDNIHRSLKNPALTIGNFDGVHRGHQALFRQVKEWARKLEGESVVITFQPHPLEVLFPGKGPVFITSHERRLELIADCGIDVTIVVPFNTDFAKMSARDFVKDILVRAIGVKAIVVGYDYRFGFGREGNIEFLKKLGREYGYEVETVSAIQFGETMVSSTAIRECIKDGELREACRLLGRPYEISGVVVKGRERGGRLLGFPTANISISASTQASPKLGVYAVEVKVGEKRYGGAANLGYNPTFGDTDLSLEVHIFDFNEDLYGKPITVSFVDRLREEKRFSGPKELALQIQKDVKKAREILAEKCNSLSDQ